MPVVQGKTGNAFVTSNTVEKASISFALAGKKALGNEKLHS